MRNILRTMHNLDIKQFVLSVIKWVFIICIIYVILMPILTKGIESIKSYNDLMDSTVNHIPKKPTLKNFTDAMNAMKYLKSFMNSTLLALSISLIQVLSCTFIGYGLGRFDFPGKKLLCVLVIVTLLIPPQTIMTSLFMKFRFFDFFGIFTLITGKPLNVLDSFTPFLLLSITGFGLKNGLYIYLMTQFLKGIPKEMEESGYVDGANSFQIFVKIMLPMAKTMMITVFLFSFSWAWTDTYYPRLFLSQLITLPSSVSAIANYGRDIDPATRRALFSAATILILAPIGLLYFFTQKHYIEGLEKSGIVG